jgi:hypothetical protein
VLLDYTFHISETKTKSLHIVDISGLHPVETVKNLLQVLSLYSHSVILHRKTEFVTFVPSTYIKRDRHTLTAILDGIVNRIGLALLFGLVLEMHAYGFWLGDALAGFTPFFIGIVFYYSGRWKKRSV